MSAPIQCSFCEQTFDFDSSDGSLLANCPHCGKQNTVAGRDSGAPKMSILHDAPTLRGGKACPSCNTQAGREAMLCVQCGYNFKTGEKATGGSWFAKHKFLVLSQIAGVIFSIAILAFVFWPEQKTTHSSGSTAKVSVKPVAVPSAKEIAATEAEAERAAFKDKKKQAEATLRRQFDEREPLYHVSETVELRRQNGVFHKGTLQGFSGEGTNRLAVVATSVGEVGIPLTTLDKPSRRRIDADYRERVIQHLLSTGQPAEPEK